MRLLITGGGGYLGYWVVREALSKGHVVRVFDRFSFLSEGMTPETLFVENNFGRNLEIIPGDIRRLQEQQNLLYGIEGVIHLAGLSSDPTCALDPEIAYEVNVECTRELARQCIQSGIRPFVFASTCAVYGQGVFPILDEESPVNPVSVFAETKIEAEKALLDMSSAQFTPRVARMGTLFGISGRMRFDLAVNHMTASAVRNRSILVKGGGNQWRPFIHVRNAAQILVSLASDTDLSGKSGIFNVGWDTQNCTIAALAEKVAARCSQVPVTTARDDDDQRNYKVRFSKIAETVPLPEQISFEEGIDELKVYLDNPDINPFSEAFFNVERMKKLRATPVDAGGEPVAARFIALSKPNLGEDEERAVLQVLRSGWLTSGPQITFFEKSFAEKVNAPYAVSVSSCTAALHLCLAALAIKPGDEVITSPITWASTGNTILTMGATVRFVDVDPHTLNMDPLQLEATITEKTRAIIPVHMAGLSCNMDPIRAIAKRHGIPVIEDAAHAFGSEYRKKPVGAEGLACFSFYATKNITTMEGGMITTDDESLAHRLRRLAGNGMGSSAWDRYGRSAVSGPAEVLEPGYKYALSNVSAALGVEQLKKFEQFRAARKRIAELYLSVLSDVPELEMPPDAEDGRHAWHLFIIKIRPNTLSVSRNSVIEALRRENIGTGIHFYGLHLHQYYREVLGMRPEDFPQATDVSDRIISLPLHPGLNDRHVQEVVSALKKVISYHRL